MLNTQQGAPTAAPHPVGLGVHRPQGVKGPAVEQGVGPSIGSQKPSWQLGGRGALVWRWYAGGQQGWPFWPHANAGLAFGRG